MPGPARPPSPGPELASPLPAAAPAASGHLFGVSARWTAAARGCVALALTRGRWGRGRRRGEGRRRSRAGHTTPRTCGRGRRGPLPARGGAHGRGPTPPPPPSPGRGRPRDPDRTARPYRRPSAEARPFPGAATEVGGRGAPPPALPTPALGTASPTRPPQALQRAARAAFVSLSPSLGAPLHTPHPRGLSRAHPLSLSLLIPFLRLGGSGEIVSRENTSLLAPRTLRTETLREEPSPRSPRRTGTGLVRVVPAEVSPPAGALAPPTSPPAPALARPASWQGFCTGSLAGLQGRAEVVMR